MIRIFVLSLLFSNATHSHAQKILEIRHIEKDRVFTLKDGDLITCRLLGLDKYYVGILQITSDDTITISRKKGKIQHHIFIGDIWYISSEDVHSATKKLIGDATGVGLFWTSEFDINKGWDFSIKDPEQKPD